MDDQSRYTAKLFIHSVLPLFKVVALETSLRRAWLKHDGIVQFDVNTDEGHWGIHFTVAAGQLTPAIGLHDSPDVAFSFKDVDHFNRFFRSETKKMPKISGFKRFRLLAISLQTLLKMSSLLGAKTAPRDLKTQALVTKMMFYLLTSGISRLNKLGEPTIAKWAATSPKRVYQLVVTDLDDISAYIVVQAGRSRASRGLYTRSKPFFTMRFADLDSALAILLQTGDLLALTAEQKLTMQGAPEFGAKFGDFMMMVGDFIQ